MTRIYRIAGLFLLTAMISIIVQGIQLAETSDVSQIDTWNPAASMTTGAGEGGGNLQVVQITNQTGEHYLPRISGNWIIWEGFENYRDEGGLYLYDIANGSEKRILDTFAFISSPEISGNWIGWVENRSDSSGNYLPCVCVYNILNGTTIQLTEYPAMPMQTSESLGLSADRISTLDLSGDVIVWHDRRDGNMDIFYSNLSSGEDQIKLSSSPADDTCPSISGDLVVWSEQYETEGYSIILYNLTSGKQKRITDAPVMCRNQRISGGNVVWSQWRERGTDYDICCYNLSSGNTTWITNEPILQLWPRISGDVIVWPDDRGGADGDIYAYDLSTQTELPVTDDSVDQNWADVDGNNIVWSDNRTGNSEIFLCSLANASDNESRDESDNESRMYTVQLSSIPGGADIYVDDEPQGCTPATLSFDQPGDYQIELVKRGFRPYLATLDVSTSMTYVVNLEREVAGPPAGRDSLITITVDSVPRGANVSIDEKIHGTTLFEEVGLPPSDYLINVTLEGYQPNSTTLSPSGPTNAINVTLIPQTGEADGD
jgi:beta propeller repeat protein